MVIVRTMDLNATKSITKTGFVTHDDSPGTEFKCRRCGYCTPRKALLIKHLQRVQECPPVYSDQSTEELLKLIPRKQQVPYEVADDGGLKCACGKVLRNLSGLRYHRASQCPLSSSASAPMSTMQDEIASLREQVMLLKQQCNVTNHTNHHNINNIENNITQTVTNHITINAFGKECLDHISSQFLDQCVRRTDKGLVELIEKIHFDPDHQENCNLKITNLRLPIMQVHNGTSWKYDKKDKILSELVDKGHGLMQDHFDDHEDRIRDQVSQTMFDHIRKWMDKMADRDKKTLESVLTDMYVLILNAGAD